MSVLRAAYSPKFWNLEIRSSFQSELPAGKNHMLEGWEEFPPKIGCKGSHPKEETEAVPGLFPIEIVGRVFWMPSLAEPLGAARALASSSLLPLKSQLKTAFRLNSHDDAGLRLSNWGRKDVAP